MTDRHDTVYVLNVNIYKIKMDFIQKNEFYFILF